MERLRRWTTKQCFTHEFAFRPFSHGQSRLHLGIPPEERRRQLSVALLRYTGEKPRARSGSTRLPFFPSRRSSGWRRWLCSEWYRPSGDHCRPLKKWKLIQVWRARVRVKLSCRSRQIFHSSEKKQTGNELVSVKWQRSSRHVRQKCSRQNPCHPARFDLYAQDDVFANAPFEEKPCNEKNELFNSQTSSNPLVARLKVWRFPIDRSLVRTLLKTFFYAVLFSFFFVLFLDVRLESSFFTHHIPADNTRRGTTFDWTFCWINNQRRWLRFR